MKFYIAAFALVASVDAASDRSPSNLLLNGSLKQRGRHLRSLQEPEAVACDDDIAQFLEGAASANQNLEAQGLGMECQCLTEEEDLQRLGGNGSFISCRIDRGKECAIRSCALGWDCTNPEETSVEVCSEIQEEQIWAVTADGNFSRLFVRDKRIFTKGVTNLESREVDLNKETDECQLYVDEQVCNSCELCSSSSVSLRGVVVGDCTNIVPDAVTVCNSPIGFLMKLLELNADPDYGLEAGLTTATAFPTFSETSAGESTLAEDDATEAPTFVSTPLRGSSAATVTFNLPPVPSGLPPV